MQALQVNFTCMLAGAPVVKLEELLEVISRLRMSDGGTMESFKSVGEDADKVEEEGAVYYSQEGAYENEAQLHGSKSASVAQDSERGSRADEVHAEVQTWQSRQNTTHHYDVQISNSLNISANAYAHCQDTSTDCCERVYAGKCITQPHEMQGSCRRQVVSSFVLIYLIAFSFPPLF